MAEVDINDESIHRFSIFHHRYDEETKHFRWIGIKAFDNRREWKKYLDKAFVELAYKKNANQAHRKEQLTGYEMAPGYGEDSKRRRIERKLGTLFFFAQPRQFSLFRRRKFLPGYEMAYREYEASTSEVVQSEDLI